MRDDEIYSKVQEGLKTGEIGTEREKERAIQLCKEFNVQFGRARTSVENHIRSLLLWALARGSGHKTLFRERGGVSSEKMSSGDVLNNSMNICVLLTNDLLSRRKHKC